MLAVSRHISSVLGCRVRVNRRGNLVFRKTWSILISLAIIVTLLIVWTANITRFSLSATTKETQGFSSSPIQTSKTSDVDSIASPCATALEQNAVCDAANKRVLEIMNAS